MYLTKLFLFKQVPDECPSSLVQQGSLSRPNSFPSSEKPPATCYGSKDSHPKYLLKFNRLRHVPDAEDKNFGRFGFPVSQETKPRWWGTKAGRLATRGQFIFSSFLFWNLLEIGTSKFKSIQSQKRMHSLFAETRRHGHVTGFSVTLCFLGNRE